MHNPNGATQSVLALLLVSLHTVLIPIPRFVAEARKVSRHSKVCLTPGNHRAQNPSMLLSERSMMLKKVCKMFTVSGYQKIGEGDSAYFETSEGSPT